MRKPITALLGLSLIGLSAIADEVWSTPIGDVVYEDETDEGRTAYAGIWIEAESPGIELCDVAVTDPATGESHYNWGRVDIVFTEPDFPGGWVALRGSCFNDPGDYLIGKPVTAIQE